MNCPRCWKEMTEWVHTCSVPHIDTTCDDDVWFECRADWTRHKIDNRKQKPRYTLLQAKIRWINKKS